LKPLALLVLLVQALGSVSASAPWRTGPAAPSGIASADEHACCKGMAPGQMCPMHENGRAGGESKRPAAGDCRLSSGCAPLDVALTGVGSAGATVPGRLVVDPRVAAVIVRLLPTMVLASWQTPPPSRPPRA
jgi:hypothetical protein